MRKGILILFFVIVFFIFEYYLFNMFGRWFMPNLLLLLIIYFNLAFGIRYSIFAAVWAGVLKDSFGPDIFGLHIFVFVICAYMTTFLKRYFHYVASRRSRLLIVFFVTFIHVGILYCIHTMFGKINVVQMVRFVLVPEIVTTLLVTSFIFSQLRKCVLKLFA